METDLKHFSLISETPHAGISKESYCFCLNSYFGIVQWDLSSAARKFRASPRWIVTAVCSLSPSVYCSNTQSTVTSTFILPQYCNMNGLKGYRNFDMKMLDYPTIRIKYQVTIYMTHNFFHCFSKK